MGKMRNLSLARHWGQLKQRGVARRFLERFFFIRNVVGRLETANLTPEKMGIELDYLHGCRPSIRMQVIGT
jgi:hypothetical protein